MGETVDLVPLFGADTSPGNHFHVNSVFFEIFYRPYDMKGKELTLPQTLIF